MKHLAFAKKYESGTARDCGQVIFSDELTFQQFMVQKGHVRRPKGKRFEEKYTMPTVKYPSSQMIWGAMSVNETAALYFLPEGVTMNGS